jgi:hypothetical protein
MIQQQRPQPLLKPLLIARMVPGGRIYFLAIGR